HCPPRERFRHRSRFGRAGPGSAAPRKRLPEWGAVARHGTLPSEIDLDPGVAHAPSRVCAGRPRERHSSRRGVNMRQRFVISAILLAFAVVPMVFAIEEGKAATEKKVELAVGDKAPLVEAKDDEGKSWKLADHVGERIVVLYF